MNTPVSVGLLDTSVVITLGRLSEDQLPAFPMISAITLAELSVGPLVASDASTRNDRQLVLQSTEASFDPLPFNDDCARRFGQVASELRMAGSKSRARAFDALIAATALAHDLSLYTCNERDFTGISGLSVISVNPR